MAFPPSRRIRGWLSDRRRSALHRTQALQFRPGAAARTPPSESAGCQFPPQIAFDALEAALQRLPSSFAEAAVLAALCPRHRTGRRSCAQCLPRAAGPLGERVRPCQPSITRPSRSPYGRGAGISRGRFLEVVFGGSGDLSPICATWRGKFTANDATTPDYGQMTIHCISSPMKIEPFSPSTLGIRCGIRLCRGGVFEPVQGPEGPTRGASQTTSADAQPCHEVCSLLRSLRRFCFRRASTKGSAHLVKENNQHRLELDQDFFNLHHPGR